MWLFPFAVLCQITAILASHPECGKDDGKRGGTIGHSTGDESDTLKQPWSVAIVLPTYDGEGTRLHCSGSILDEKTILTAAHCFLGEFPEKQSEMTIIVGANQPTNEDNLEKRKRWVSRKEIKSVEIHPDYDGVLFSAKYDLALVTIKGRFRFKDTIWPICIPEEVRQREYHSGKGYRLVGYGKDINNPELCDDFECLKEDSLNAQPTVYCSSKYGQILNTPFDPFHDLIKKALPKNFDEEDSLICAGIPGQNAGTCPGDSGGILMSKTFKKDIGFITTQQAVVHGSRSECDGERYPSIFVRLDNCEVLRWIFENVFPDKKPKCDKPSSTPPTSRPRPPNTPPTSRPRPPNTPATPATPFITGPILGDSVILLQTGQTRSKSKSSEILDPKTQKAISCNVEDYPIEVEEAAGDLVGGIPMACGGYQGGTKGPTKKCFKLVAGQWIESGEMSVVRRRHAAIEVTVNGEKALWVTGGWDNSGTFYKSTEFVYPDGRVVAGIDLPKRRRSHCMAKLDSTRSLIISGYVYEDGEIGGGRSASTLIYDSEKNSIESGPDLKKIRASPACGVFTSTLLQAPLVMVAGGSGGGNAVELWDYTRNFGAGWYKGKNLPSAQTSGSRLTENGNKDGALITLGNKIYEMKHTHSSGGREWVRIKPDLKIARTYHLFFSVPLSATGC